jgi:aspartyl/asparaginyl-tRNA synthetase
LSIAFGLPCPKRTTVFKIQSEVSLSIREYLRSQDFNRNPHAEAVGCATEGGGRGFFKFDYFGKEGYAGPEPQFYSRS